MTAHRLISRRMLLKDMGKAGLAVMVLGTAACRAAPTDNATPTDEIEPTTTAVSGTTSSTKGLVTTSTTTTADQYSWQRVDLDFVSAYILYRGGRAIIVDTGVDGSALSIGSALDEIGLGWGDVSGLVVTHRHPDHQGSVQGVLANAPDVHWFAGAADLGAITAPTAGQAVGDDDTINGDLQIIETPGHTAGHISVLDPLAGILVTGDALNGEGGGVVGANPGFSEDMSLADASVAKLAGFDYEVALFGHGDPILSDASDQVAALAETLGG
jgi:glyoxylase-like metal-dependent hydrolase (beta-lactamase superfamily II)